MNDKNKLIIVRDYHLKSEVLERHYNTHVAKLAQQVRDPIAFMNKTFFLISWGLEKPTITRNQDVRDVFHLLLCRAMKGYRAVCTTLEAGLEQDALALLRNMVETTITIKYMATDQSGALAQRFREYADVERYKNMQKNRRLDPAWQPPGGAAEATRIETATQAFKTKYQIQKTKSWHGFASLDVLASQASVDMYGDYVRAYSTYCLLTHPSYLADQAYSPDPGRYPHATWAPSMRKTLEVACLSTTYLIKVVEVYAGHLGINSDDLTNALNEVRTNLIAQNKMGGWAPGNLKIEVGEGMWGILPANLQAGLGKDG